MAYAKIFVKPGTLIGRTASIRHPSNYLRPVPVEGCFLPHDPFTRARIAEGGLVVADAPKADADPAPAATEPAPRTRAARSPHEPTE